MLKDESAARSQNVSVLPFGPKTNIKASQIFTLAFNCSFLRFRNPEAEEDPSGGGGRGGGRQFGGSCSIFLLAHDR